MDIIRLVMSRSSTGLGSLDLAILLLELGGSLLLLATQPLVIELRVLGLDLVVAVGGFLTASSSPINQTSLVSIFVLWDIVPAEERGNDGWK